MLLADEDKQPVFVPPLTSWEQGRRTRSIAVAEHTKVAADTPFRVERFEVNTGLKQAAGCARCSSIPPIAGRFATPPSTTHADAGWARGRRRARSARCPRGVQLPAGAEADRGDRLPRQSRRRRIGRARSRFYFAEKAAQSRASSMDRAAPISVAAGKTRERVRAEITIKTAT